jgi:FkbM family methyltransferase
MAIYTATEAAELVHGLYRALLGRDADPAALRHWCAVLGDASATLDQLAAALAASEEYRARSGAARARDDSRARFLERVRPLFAAAPLRIVDVGAQILDDEQHVYTPLAEHGLACDVVGFEPLEDKLVQRQRQDGAGSVRMYPNFIGDGARHTFHINAPDATSSLLPFNRALTAQLVDLSQLQTVRREEVATSTLDGVLDDGAAIDFLKLDIQGFELPALRHATQVLARTSVVHCEVSFAEIYAGQGLFSDIEPLLRAHGFDFIDLSSSCRYACHGPDTGARDRLGWGDAIFYKRPAQLDARALLAQAAIAWLVYGKPSLAASLAARAGADYAALLTPEASLP